MTEEADFEEKKGYNIGNTRGKNQKTRSLERGHETD